MYSGGKTVLCVVCGKEHYRTPYQINKGNNHPTCSTKCKGVWLLKNLTGEKTPNFKDSLITRYCINCDNSFTTYTKKQRYCSTKCKGIASITRISTTCLNCNIEFSTFKSYKKDRSFCSQKCTKEYLRRENHPSYIKDRSKLMKYSITLFLVILALTGCMSAEYHDLAGHIEAEKLSYGKDVITPTGDRISQYPDKGNQCTVFADRMLMRLQEAGYTDAHKVKAKSPGSTEWDHWFVKVNNDLIDNNSWFPYGEKKCGLFDPLYFYDIKGETKCF